jgi:hypothetical protein
LSVAARTAVSAVKAIYGTDDSAAIQAALAAAGNGTVALANRNYFLGITGIQLNGRSRLMGQGRNGTAGGGNVAGKGTCLLYAGSGVGVKVNATGVTTDVETGNFTVDGNQIGMFGVEIGTTTGSVKSAQGLYGSIRCTGSHADGAGWRLVSCQETNFLNCEGSLNSGDGWLIDDLQNTGNVHVNWFGCRFEANTKRGLYMKQAANFAFYGCLYQTNGQEGVLYERANNASLTTRDVIFHSPYFEVNNNGRGTGYYQFKQTCLGASLIANTELIHPYFSTPGTGNQHILLDKGTLTVWYPQLNSAAPGGTVTSSTSATLTVYDKGDPTSDWSCGANAVCVFDVIRSGGKSIYVNVSGTVTKVLDIGPGNKIGVLGTAAGSKATVTGSRGGNAALASLLTAMAGFGWITDSSTA